jgi:hypothetical protein
MLDDVQQLLTRPFGFQSSFNQIMDICAGAEPFANFPGLGFSQGQRTSKHPAPGAIISLAPILHHIFLTRIQRMFPPLTRILDIIGMESMLPIFSQ